VAFFEWVIMTVNGSDCEFEFRERYEFQLEGCRAYARAMNNLDASLLEPWLSDDFVSYSQLTWDDGFNRQTYLKYIKEKLDNFKAMSYFLEAEIAYHHFAGACVILTQHTIDVRVTTVDIKTKGGKISSTCMCVVPAPQECYRTGEIPW
jgi:hypothetical protein